MNILILCTGNTCRSQMAEGILKALDPELHVYSAGTKAEEKVNPFAIKAMAEIGLDISKQQPEPVSIYLGKAFDYVITVCDGARENCPVFTGKVKHRLHFGFEDPAAARGTEDEIMPVYRKVRDQIKEMLNIFFQSININKDHE